ncbi:hypothetical protein M0R45_035099 [Rubus argutus]|uniref:E3 ubiquitin-protein ligase ATL4 n=1 Tax=Rubus argutus TaxID=59490 RepID=A0AAW1VV54_RUBAR
MSGAPPPPPPLLSIPSEPHHRPLTVKTLSPSILIILLIVLITVVASFSLCRLLRCVNSRFLRHATPSSSGDSAADPHRISSRRVSQGRNCRPGLHLLTPGLHFLHHQAPLLHRRRRSRLRRLPQTCPLCRSPISASDSELMTLVANAGSVGGGDSFRLEIGNVSRRQTTTTSNSSARRSYSIGSFDYLVDDESEVQLTSAHGSSDRKEEVIIVMPPPPPPLPSEDNLAADVASGRSWLKEFVDRLSSSSRRSSGRFFTGSSRRSEIGGAGEWISESGQVGMELSEYFRWLSEV